ncbi:CD59 glycoprotein [Austrofundulus limnaeus]|uniref:CD59 glycoprotein n=1 Tax=Austrofundulus limnaeus TaxID=52670 RepID=A0A2I4ARC9_AUSLI|nr:PREDICTED: CD59 glycoprotein-like [Austrofundulus limnaeus]
MQFYGALILLVTFSAACGLRCYSCTAADPKSCTDTTSCAVIFNRCYSLLVKGTVTKGCQNSATCIISSMACCEGDLCNSGVAAGPSVVLLLVASALLTFFI